MKGWILMLTAFLAFAAISPARSAPSISAADWSAYKSRFLQADGRIVDDANGNISHSEGQGYGLLLAYLADDRADFELIWTFTQNELLLRDDHLAAWKWDPRTTPHVTDVNNATDGDILIAYALALAGRSWNEAEMTRTASVMVKALGREVLAHQEDHVVLLPGTKGFSRKDRRDGPVVNLSYWVFEAFPVFAGLDPDDPWNEVAGEGVRLLSQNAFGPRGLPPEWLSLAGDAKPASGFAPQFAYNAVRIPLYLVRAGIENPEILDRIADGMSVEGGVGVIDLASGAVEQTLTDPGYRIIPALAKCVTGNTPIPSDLLKFNPTSYFPSTLQLLALSYIADHGGKCR